MNVDQAYFEENERLTAPVDHRQFQSIGPVSTESGGRLADVTIAYESWGELSSSKDNAIIICHAVSGDSHAIGWWERLIGPGKAIDTNQFFVIGTNVLGGCQGSTGPTSLDEYGNRYNTKFPVITVGDMIEAQSKLLDALGIERLHAVCGGSMGGMQALEWTLRFPDRVKRAWITASCAAHNAMQIGFNEVARQAIMSDPKWAGGNYLPEDAPTLGLTISRMVGHLSYLSEAAFETKFARRLQDKSKYDYSLDVEFQVESYLRHQGHKFTKRFDANSLLYLTRAIDYFDRTKFGKTRTEFLFTSFTSDWLYPSHQSQTLHELASKEGCKSQWIDIDLPFGHDAFLLDEEYQPKYVRKLLE